MFVIKERFNKEKEYEYDYDTLEKHETSLKDLWWVACITFIAMLAFILTIFSANTFLGEKYLVDGESMNPTLEDGQIIRVKEQDSYKNGDIVIIDVGDKGLSKGNKKPHYIVKRVIGIEDDKLTYDGNSYKVNDTVVEEEYGFLINHSSGKTSEIRYGNFTNDGSMYKPISKEESNELLKHYFEFDNVIPKGKVFVLGDNRGNSTDSRELGLINVEDIVGKVIRGVNDKDRGIYKDK